MINDYGNARFVQLEEELDLFNEMGISPIEKLTGIIKSVNQGLSDLKIELLKYPFKDKAEEIHFFKKIKPRFLACHIYAVELFTIESNKPIGDDLVFKNYYEQELKFIRKFFDKHQFLYQYYLLDGQELDGSFFVRGVQQTSVLLHGAPDMDAQFSTACDYIYSRFIAYEQLQEYLIQCLYDPAGMQPYSRSSKKRGPFKWTGDKSNLVELAYGIYDTLQINEGNITIAEIIEWLEESLEINLSRYYRRFSEIKMRKSLSKTKYLDEMAVAVNKHITAGEPYKPKPRKPASKPN
jgi:hypothetical protein